MWVCKIGNVIYTWTPDGKGDGVLNDGNDLTPCKTLHEAERIMVEDWGEDENEISWGVVTE